MKKEEYYVAITIHGLYTVEVNASDIIEAEKKAWEKFEKVKLPIDEVDCHTCCIEDPSGKTHYFY